MGNIWEIHWKYMGNTETCMQKSLYMKYTWKFERETHEKKR